MDTFFQFRRSPSSILAVLSFALLSAGAIERDSTQPYAKPGAPAASSALGEKNSRKRLNTFDAGDTYQTSTGSRKLLRAADSVVVQIKSQADYETALVQLTNATGPLPGYKPSQQLSRNRLLLTTELATKPGRALSALKEQQRMLSAIRQKKGVQQANPVYVDTSSNLRLVTSGELIIRLRPETDPKTYFGLDWPKVRSMPGTQHVYLLSRTDTSSEELLAEATRLSQDPDVVWAEPDFLTETVEDKLPDDPLLAQQWHHYNSGQGGRSDADIKSRQAWDITIGNSNIVIAVIDSGTELGHPDLAANIFKNPNETQNGADDDHNGYTDDLHGWNFYNNNNNPNPNHAGDNHGTATAGCAASAGNNKIGVSGVAYRCKIMPIKIASGNDWISHSSFAEVFYYAAGRAKNGVNTWRGADVLSISLHFTRSTVVDEALHWAATQGRNGKGCPIFASAGNDGSGWYGYKVDDISAGTHTFRFAFTKDGSAYDGEDTFWLDDITFPGAGREGFEGDSFPPTGWTTSASAPWELCDDPAHVRGTGTRSARAGSIGNYGTSWIQVTKTVSGGRLSFYTWSSSEYRYDVLKVYVDGVLKGGDPGGVNLWTRGSIVYPASHPDVIAVGASTDYDYRSDYSQFGPGLALVAPSSGGDKRITTTDRTGSSGYNTGSGASGNFCNDFGGTSASCPIAAAAGALALSVNPNLTSAEVRSLLCNSADKIGLVPYSSGWNQYYGYGRLNVYAALAKLSGAPLISTSPSRQSVIWTGTAIFYATVSGVWPFSYQWIHNGTNIVGATGSTLELTNIQPSYTGKYAVQVSNSVATVTSAPASLTVSVLKVPLALNTLGRGSVTPLTNGQMLDIGRTYNVTATPANGHSFAGWLIDGVQGPQTPTLRFVMHSDLALVAMFNDSAKPTVSILSPAAGARVTNALLRVTGRASDNMGVSRVFATLDGSEVEAVGRTNWEVFLNPAPGTNYIQVRSEDGSGNQSAVATRSVFYVVPSSIRVLTEGAGSVTPIVDGSMLEIGRNYRIQAKPAAGNLFAGWEDGSTNATRTFQMNSNLVLTARFVPNPFISRKGYYNALFSRTNDTSRLGAGILDLTLNDAGTFSGNLSIFSAASDLSKMLKYSFSGKFWVDGKARVLVPRAPLSPLQIDLQLALTEDTDLITGTVTTEHGSAELSGHRAGFDSVIQKSPQAGRHTIVFQSDLRGDGFAESVTDSTGLVRLSGALPDGTAFNSSGRLSKNGELPVFAVAAGGKDLLRGWLNIPENSANPISGSLLLDIPDASNPSLHIQTAIDALGSRYVNTAGTRILNLTNATLLLDDAQATTSIPVVLGANNRISAQSGTNLSASITATNGLLKGTFLNAAKETIYLRGMALQHTNQARGYYIKNGVVEGRVLLRSESESVETPSSVEF